MNRHRTQASLLVCGIWLLEIQHVSERPSGHPDGGSTASLTHPNHDRSPGARVITHTADEPSPAPPLGRSYVASLRDRASPPLDPLRSGLRSGSCGVPGHVLLVVVGEWPVRGPCWRPLVSRTLSRAWLRRIGRRCSPGSVFGRIGEPAGLLGCRYAQRRSRSIDERGDPFWPSSA